jgi:hypothetical protein
VKPLPLIIALVIPAVPALIVALSFLGLIEAAPFGVRPDGFAGMHPLAAIGWGFGVYFIGLTLVGFILMGIETFKRNNC